MASTITAGLVALGMHGHVAWTTEFVAAWDTFALTTLVLAWVAMTTKDPYEVRRKARLQDGSQTFLFMVVVSAAAACFLAVLLMLGPARSMSPERLVVPFSLAIAAVVLSWLLVHTLFTLRYAHLFYIEARKKHRDDIEGGLVFPGKGNPDYLDFAYFSFVIGMTCQVSDVQISSKGLRRLALVHGLISFAFNTAILAMMVNIVAGRA